MGWHLRPLWKCDTCGKAASEQLYNAANAPMTVYCSRHAAAALREAQAKYEPAQPPAGQRRK